MKLYWIELLGSYKGLKDQRFEFGESNGGLSVIIGLNGSGKSQLLELIAETFSYLERKARPDFRTRKPLGFTVKICYSKRQAQSREMNTYHLIINENGKVLRNIDGRILECTSDLSPLDLPNFVIGCSSGLNENLQRSFLKNAIQFLGAIEVKSSWIQFQERLRRVVESQGKNLTTADLERIERDRSEAFDRHFKKNPGVFEWGLGDGELEFAGLSDTMIPGHIFLDYDCCALLYFCLGLESNFDLDRIFSNIPFRYPKFGSVKYDLRKHLHNPDAIADVRQLIAAAGGASFVKGRVKTTDKIYDETELEFLEGVIQVDFLNPQTRASMLATYHHSLNLFVKLYKILLLGAKKWPIRDRKSLTDDRFFGSIKKPLKIPLPVEIETLTLTDGLSEISFDDMSDGEFQLVQFLGALRVFSGAETLFLIDEPETHSNPSWRINFHKLIEASVRTLVGGEESSHILITTHSPYIVSALQSENVHLMKRSEAGVEMSEVTEKTFGASYETIVKQNFELKSLISQTAINEIRKKIHELPTLDAIEWINANLGESAEKAYLLRQLRNHLAEQ